MSCDEKDNYFNEFRDRGGLTLKSWAPQGACGFESRPRHFRISGLAARGFCSLADLVLTLSKLCPKSFFGKAISVWAVGVAT
jgi:hypothetical protein